MYAPVIFVSAKTNQRMNKILETYQRYLENKIRENFGFEGTPVQFEYREKNRK